MIDVFTLQQAFFNAQMEIPVSLDAWRMEVKI